MHLEPLALSNFADFESLTACGDDGKICFCSFWHVKVGSLADYDAMKADGPAKLRGIMRSKVEAGFHVGALAYDAGSLVAWVSVGVIPEVYWCWRRIAALGAERAAKTAGITCVTLAPTARGRGALKDVATALLAYGRERGWDSIEAYPFDEALTRGDPKLAWPGFERPYREAGFEKVEPHWLSRPGSERWIYRATLASP